LIELQAKLR